MSGAFCEEVSGFEVGRFFFLHGIDRLVLFYVCHWTEMGVDWTEEGVRVSRAIILLPFSINALYEGR